ncbi:hypothetical protein Cantr_01363 [Candida viswanathii]|jgi:hypothetical protein|uniref:Uncharacterized protein n=1 Tax=Candida viswanathii TaxID=5486 RepID=A0A367YKB5_9ASCO|nr:hypothetical protein Cantr_01363 [Candida viswanathii]
MFTPFYYDPYTQGYDDVDGADAIDLESLFDLLHQHQFYHKENTRPRIVKKLETEDEFQIQIFKPYGNFQNYEVSVVRSTPPIVNVVITSIQDNFQTSIPFNVNYIDIQNINWQWYKAENLLVLNIPKRIHFVHSNVQDILNCLLGHQEEEDEEDGEAELDAHLDNSLADHDKLIAEATAALKNPQQQPYSDKQVQQDFQSKARATTAAAKAAQAGKKREQFIRAKKELEAQRKAQQDYQDKYGDLAARDANLQDTVQEHEDLIALAVNALKQVSGSSSKQVKQDLQAKEEHLAAGAQAAAEARKKEEADKVTSEIEAQRRAAHAKILAAQKELEEIAKKEAEAEKAHNVARQRELEQAKAKVEAEEHEAEDAELAKKQEYEEFVKKQQEFLQQFFGLNLGPVIPGPNGANAFYTNDKANGNGNSKQPQAAKKEKPKVAPKPKQFKSSPKVPTVASAAVTAASNGKKAGKLRHSPSLEEVEDEESVLYNKKFGH